MAVPNARAQLKRSSGGGRSRGSGSSRISSSGRSSGIYSNVPGAGTHEGLAYVQALEAERALDSDTTSKAPDDEAVRSVVRLLQSPDRKAQEEGAELLRENSDIITDETAARYGLTEALKSVQSEGKRSNWDKVKGAGLKTLEVIGRPGQAVLELGQAGLVDAGVIDREGAEQGGYRDAVRALKGEERWDATRGERTNRIDLASAVGTDSRTFDDVDNPALRWVGKGANFVGEAAVDPLMLVGGPGRKATERGAQAAAQVIARDAAQEGAQALSRRLARRLPPGSNIADLSPEAAKVALRRTGARRGLTPSQREATRQALLEGADTRTKGLISGTRRQVATRGDGPINAALRTMTGREVRTGAERSADKAMQQLMRHDRGGLKFAGRSVVPEPVRAAIRPALRTESRFIGPAALQRPVIAQGAEAAADFERRADRFADLEMRSHKRAELIREKGQEVPFAKLQDEIDQAAVRLDELRATAPGKQITDDLVDEDTIASLTAVRDELSEQARRATAGLNPESTWDEMADLLTPEAVRLQARAAEYARLLERGDYDQLLRLFDDLTPAAKGGAPTFTRAPLKATRDAEKAGRATLRDLEREAATRAREYSKYVDNREAELSRARAKAETLGGPEGIPLSRKAESALSGESDKAAGYAARRQEALAKADELYEASAGGNVAKLLELDPGLGNALRASKVTINPNNLGARISRSKLGEALSTGFSPRAGMRRSASLPEGTDELFYKLQSRTQSAAGQAKSKTIRELNAASKKIGKVSDEELTTIRNALEVEGGVPAAATQFRAAGRPELAEYTELLDTIRTRDFETLVDYGLADALKLRAPDEYLPHVLTKAGRKAMEVGERTGRDAVPYQIQASGAKAAARQGGALDKRTLYPELNLTEKNARVAADLAEDGIKVKKGEDIFAQDPASLVAQRSVQVQTAKESAQFVDDLADSLKDAVGGKLVMPRARPGASKAELASLEKAARKRGLEKVDLGESGITYAHPDLAPEIRKTLDVMSDDAAIKGLGDVFDGWQRVWKSYATVPIIGGIGFHSRNFTGNIFNNFLAGVSNPRYYGEAMSLQRSVARAKKKYPNKSVPDALTEMGVAPNKVAKVEAAMEEGVINEGFFAIDLGKGTPTAIKPRKGEGGKLGRAINPLSTDNKLVSSGTAVGQAVEENARMAHFLSKMDELGDIGEAGLSVKKYLFDYGDLTNFERKVGKRVHAFYTFTRKNTPVVISELARNPAKFNRLAGAERAMLGTHNAEPGDALAPDYLTEGGGMFTGKGLSRAITGNDNPLVGNLDTTFLAAAETVDPVVQLLGMTPGVKGLVPDDMVDDKPAEQMARSLVGQLVGGPAELFKIGMEEASGHSAFTGGAIEVDGKRRDNMAVRLSNAIIPLVSKTDRAYNLQGKDGTDSARLRLVKALTGLTAREITPEVTEAQIRRRVYDLRDALEALKAEGVNVPTIQQLQRAELVPTPERSGSSAPRAWSSGR